MLFRPFRACAIGGHVCEGLRPSIFYVVPLGLLLNLKFSLKLPSPEWAE